MSDGRKELETILWEGADVLRSKMDANEYKDYLLSFVFYKYLSDSYLVKAFDLLNDCEPNSIEEAQRTYEEAYESEDAKDLLDDLKDSCRYVIAFPSKTKVPRPSKVPSRMSRISPA